MTPVLELRAPKGPIEHGLRETAALDGLAAILSRLFVEPVTWEATETDEGVSVVFMSSLDQHDCLIFAEQPQGWAFQGWRSWLTSDQAASLFLLAQKVQRNAEHWMAGLTTPVLIMAAQ